MSQGLIEQPSRLATQSRTILLLIKLEIINFNLLWRESHSECHHRESVEVLFIERRGDAESRVDVATCTAAAQRQLHAGCPS